MNKLQENKTNNQPTATLTAERKAEIEQNFDSFDSAQKGQVILEVERIAVFLIGDEETETRDFMQSLTERAKTQHPDFDLSLCKNFFRYLYVKEVMQDQLWERQGYTLRLIVCKSDDGEKLEIIESEYLPRFDNGIGLEIVHADDDSFSASLQLAANLSALFTHSELDSNATNRFWSMVSDRNKADADGIGNIFNMLFGESGFNRLRAQPSAIPPTPEDVCSLVKDILSSEVLDADLREALAREFAEYLTADQLILCADKRNFPQVIIDKINADYAVEDEENPDCSLQTMKGGVLASGIAEILDNPNLPKDVTNQIVGIFRDRSENAPDEKERLFYLQILENSNYASTLHTEPLDLSGMSADQLGTNDKADIRKVAELENADEKTLALALSAILKNPNTPDRLFSGIVDGIRETFNDIGDQGRVTESPEYIEAILKGLAE